MSYATGIEIGFSEDDYREAEGEGAAIPLFISRSESVLLANPVLVRVTPLTIDEALARGIIGDFPTPTDERFSPSRAGECV